MKYFKVTNLITGESYYTTSNYHSESPTHIAMREHLDPEFKYRIEEVSTRDFLADKNNRTQLDRHGPDVDEDYDYCDDEFYNIS